MTWILLLLCPVAGFLFCKAQCTSSNTTWFATQGYLALRIPSTTREYFAEMKQFSTKLEQSLAISSKQVSIFLKWESDLVLKAFIILIINESNPTGPRSVASCVSSDELAL